MTEDETCRYDASEKPRVVFAAACADIAAGLAVHGFRYARSGPKISRRVDGLGHEIHFESSGGNSAGAVVMLRGAAYVTDGRLKRWRGEAGVAHPDNTVAGGNLAAFGGCYQWNIACVVHRDEAIAECIEHIEREILPFFALCGDTARLTAHLRQHDLPGRLAWVVEYLLSRGLDAEIGPLLQGWCVRHPDEAGWLAKGFESSDYGAYQQEVRVFRRHGLEPLFRQALGGADAGQPGDPEHT